MTLWDSSCGDYITHLLFFFYVCFSRIDIMIRLIGKCNPQCNPVGFTQIQAYVTASRCVFRGLPCLPNVRYLGRGDFNMNDDGGQRGLEELGRVVDGVGVQHHQLQGAGQLKDPLNLTLHLS